MKLPTMPVAPHVGLRRLISLYRLISSIPERSFLEINRTHHVASGRTTFKKMSLKAHLLKSADANLPGWCSAVCPELIIEWLNNDWMESYIYNEVSKVSWVYALMSSFSLTYRDAYYMYYCGEGARGNPITLFNARRAMLELILRRANALNYSVELSFRPPRSKKRIMVCRG